jgi:hypothetical protein
MARHRRATLPFPFMLAELAFASWETVARRMLMIADGRCSPAEWQRSVRRAPHRGARAIPPPTANAKRLRRK